MEAKARERQTPLHIASRLGNVDIAVLLLQHGADVRAMTADHYNPLHIAAKQHNHDVSVLRFYLSIDVRNKHRIRDVYYNISAKN